MRIDAFNSANEVMTEQSAAQASAKSIAGAPQQDANDRATLSADSVSIGSLAAKALESPAMRQDKIDSLRDAVNSGQYAAEPTKIAAAMVDERV
jgi:flagellar biosynthesis anti-sigma factor FlgM